MQPGQVNAKGFVATKLPSGKIQMVDMKQPRVMGPEGRPVKG